MTMNEYEDIRPGLAVTIRDEIGTTVGVGRLGEGLDRTQADDDKLECAFPFTVREVPPGEFYTIQIGSGEEYPYRSDELKGEVAILLR